MPTAAKTVFTCSIKPSVAEQRKTWDTLDAVRSLNEKEVAKKDKEGKPIKVRMKPQARKVMERMLSAVILDASTETLAALAEEAKDTEAQAFINSIEEARGLATSAPLKGIKDLPAILKAASIQDVQAVLDAIRETHPSIKV